MTPKPARDWLRLVPALICGLLLGAHFLRDEKLFLGFLCAAVPWSMLRRKAWTRILTQGILVAGAGIWLQTMVRLITERNLLEQPWLRLATILSTVAAFNVTALILLQGPRMRRWFRIEDD